VTDSQWPDISGRIEEDETGRFHRLPIRVYFEDTDFSGVVFHASYLRWFERGRSDYLRKVGISHNKLFEGEENHEPAAFVVRRISVEFLKSASIDEILVVETRIDKVTAATFQLKQVVKRGNQALCEADVLIVLMGVSGKPRRLSKSLRAVIAVPG